MILWSISWVHFITLCQHWKQQWEVKLIYSKVKNITLWFVGLLGHNSFFVTFFSHGCQIHYVTKITYALATHKQNNLHTFSTTTFRDPIIYVPKSLKAGICQDINGSFAFSRLLENFLEGSAPLRLWKIKTDQKILIWLNVIWF